MKNLKERAFNGVFWTFFENIIGQGTQFVIQIFLARLILPEEFGLIGMITVFIAVSNSIMDCGFTNALIREKNTTQKDYSTIFYFNLGMSIMLYAILFFSAGAISEFYGQPILKSILRVLGITVIINSFGLIQRTMLTKNINFKAQMLINVAASSMSGIVAIFLAIKGFGIWSLVFRTILLQLIQSILLCIVNKWWPSLVFSIESFRKFFKFGWKLLISGLIDTVYNNLYYLIIGKVFTANDLGYYTNAQKIRDIASRSVTTSVQKVSYPVLSDINNSEGTLKESYRKIIGLAVYITFPMMIGLAVVGDSFIKIFFGEAWIPSIIYFRILCIAGMLYPLHAINLNILQVKGRSDLFLKLEIVKKAIGITLIGTVIWLNLGVIGLVSMTIVSGVISYFINSYYSSELLNYSVFEQLKDISKTVIVTIGMLIITIIVGKYINSVGIKFIIQIIVGVGSYIALSSYFELEEFKYILSIVKKLIGKVRKEKIEGEYERN